VQRNDRAPAIRMAKEVIASLDSYHFKSATAESFDKLFTAESREPWHCYTVIVYIPTKCVGVDFSTSRQSSIASRTRFMSASSNFAWV